MQWDYQELQNSGLPYKNNGNVYMLREKGMPCVNFWPEHSKWYWTGKYQGKSISKILTGTQAEFTKWYKEFYSRQEQELKYIQEHQPKNQNRPIFTKLKQEIVQPVESGNIDWNRHKVRSCPHCGGKI